MKFLSTAILQISMNLSIAANLSVSRLEVGTRMINPLKRSVQLLGKSKILQHCIAVTCPHPEESLRLPDVKD